MTIDKFEDLECWKKARELVKRIYSETSKGEFKMDFGLRDQIRKAAVSILSNIAEGFEASSSSEFIRFLGFATRSASEVQAQLYVSLDVGYLSQQVFNELYSLAEECRRLCKGMIRYLREIREVSNSKTPKPHKLNNSITQKLKNCSQGGQL